mmetsp:Transcript_11462/g.39260  ORF Transcript_11462/g.39260 Transcript_11462/m.39260 type:complete len:98 (+) Transcript_11462:1954-2247(+)
MEVHARTLPLSKISSLICITAAHFHYFYIHPHRRGVSSQTTSSQLPQYSRMGSPSLTILGMLHLRSNTRERRILNSFCTLMECDADEKMRGAFMALA